MQEGSLRCDANVNLHIDDGRQDGRHADRRDQEPEQLPVGRAGPRATRPSGSIAKWQEDGLTIKDAPKETRGWSDAEGVTKPQREKETAADYRYFPEPDLVPVVVDEAWIGAGPGVDRRAARARRQRFETEYGLSPYDANVLVEQGQDVADYYDAVARATGEYKLASNWVQQDVLRTIKEQKLTLAEFPVEPDGAGRPDQPRQARAS